MSMYEFYLSFVGDTYLNLKRGAYGSAPGEGFCGCLFNPPHFNQATGSEVKGGRCCVGRRRRHCRKAFGLVRYARGWP